MCDCTRVDKPIQGSQAAQPVNHGHSTFVYTKPAQAPERYRNFNPLGVQKDAGFSRFTPMPTDMAFDNVSLAAKGLFFQLNTLPPDWNYTAKGMATICGCGVDKIGSLMKELEAAHRVIRLRYRNKKGQLSAMVPMIVSEPDRIDEAIERARQRGFEIDPRIARANLRGSVENLDRPLSQPIVENTVDTNSCGKPSERITAKPQVTPSTGFSSTGSASTGFSASILNTMNTKTSTTTPTESDSPFEQGGTAHAEPVVSSPTAPSSDVDLQQNKKNDEAPLVRDSIEAAFWALESRAIRRTTSDWSNDEALASYRKLVGEGYSPEDIDAAYDNYVQWVESKAVVNKKVLRTWLVEDEKGFKRNFDEVQDKRAAEKRGSAVKAAIPSTDGEVDAAEYRKRSQEVDKIGLDADAEYRVEFAEQSDDEHLRNLAARVRADKPLTLGNGLVDERLSKRPSYDILWSRINKKEHHRDYVLWCYDRLKIEGKVR